MATLFNPFPSSGVIPVSFIQILPKTFGLYQINPTTNDDNAASSNAKKLIFIVL